MEGHEETGARRADERIEDDVSGEHHHPAGPNQPDSGFAEGIDQSPDPPSEQLEPDFARGERTLPNDDEPDVQGKFSRGQEQLPDTPDKNVERRFSEGIEQLPHDKH